MKALPAAPISLLGYGQKHNRVCIDNRPWYQIVGMDEADCSLSGGPIKSFRAAVSVVEAYSLSGGWRLCTTGCASDPKPIREFAGD